MGRRVTQFGVELRKKRVERGETLGEMAQKLRVSPSFLSGVETGRKRASAQLVDRIVALLDLTESEASTLRRTAQETGPEIRIQLMGKGNQAREVAAMFARCFDDDRNIEGLRGALRRIEKRGGSRGKGN